MGQSGGIIVRERESGSKSESESEIDRDTESTVGEDVLSQYREQQCSVMRCSVYN